MATKHKMTAYCPFGLQPDSLEVLIEYTYTPGSRATRIDPADPAEVDLISAKLVHHQISDMMQIMLEEWAGEYLTADGYEDACNAASDDNTSAREDAADFRRRAARDDALTERGK
jgi:hypothetical protein